MDAFLAVEYEISRILRSDPEAVLGRCSYQYSLGCTSLLLPDFYGKLGQFVTNSPDLHSSLLVVEHGRSKMFLGSLDAA